MAQLAEHWSPKPGAAGSSPAGPAIFMRIRQSKMAKTTAEKTSKLTSLMNFIREAKAELKKVTWPTRKQIWYWTLVVIVFTLCVSLYLGLIDFLLAWLFSALLG